MATAADPTSLSGKLLIAMPGMGDPRFERSVVYICVHSEDGAMGLIVNKPTGELHFSDLLEQLEIDPGAGSEDMAVFIGGPVEGGRGFVLHSGDYIGNETTLHVDDDFAMTATRDILEDIARGAGPAACLPALGYSGWAPGQLEGELQQNAWLTCDADSAIVFSRDNAGKWEKALRKLGIDPLLLSPAGGRA